MKKKVTLFVGIGEVPRQRMYHAANACTGPRAVVIAGALAPPRVESLV